MKKIQNIIILLCGLSIVAFTSKNKNLIQNAVQTPTETIKGVADSSISALRIDRYLIAMEALGFSGAIIVSEDDEVVLRKGYGYADRETRQPYSPNTVQSMGSITKQMTAAAILLLESQNQLSVNDPINKYFENVPKDKQSITIHQLLTHSSGLVGGVGNDEEPIGKQTYLARVMSEPLQFDPGISYGYSNSGYSLLGMIVEQVSGENYEIFLRNELLLPSGMTNTGYILPDWSSENMALGYRNGEKWGMVYERGWIEDGPNWNLRANGGLHTTVDDMYKWLKTVQGYGVLDGDVAKRWTTGYVSENNGYSDYGYGWVIYDHDKWGKVITHSGSNRIYTADFIWLPEKDFFCYIQGNTSMVTARSQSSNILEAAFDSTFVMPPLVEMDESAKPETAQKREGMYHLDGGHVELSADDTRLVAKLTGQSVLDLMFSHSREQRERFAKLNQRTRDAMDKLKIDQEDALAGLLREGEDPIAPTNVILKRISQIGNLDSLHVIGTFTNTPGSRFSEYGPWTTFVYAEFANWNQYWNIVWNSDATFEGEYSGPWPSFTLIPTSKNSYVGVWEGGNWRTVELNIHSDCVMLMESKACKD